MSKNITEILEIIDNDKTHLFRKAFSIGKNRDKITLNNDIVVNLTNANSYKDNNVRKRDEKEKLLEAVINHFYEPISISLDKLIPQHPFGKNYSDWTEIVENELMTIIEYKETNSTNIKTIRDIKEDAFKQIERQYIQVHKSNMGSKHHIQCFCSVIIGNIEKLAEFPGLIDKYLNSSLFNRNHHAEKLFKATGILISTRMYDSEKGGFDEEWSDCDVPFTAKINTSKQPYSPIGCEIQKLSIPIKEALLFPTVAGHHRSKNPRDRIPLYESKKQDLVSGIFNTVINDFKTMGHAGISEVFEKNTLSKTFSFIPNDCIIKKIGESFYFTSIEGHISDGQQHLDAVRQIIRILRKGKEEKPLQNKLTDEEYKQILSIYRFDDRMLDLCKKNKIGSFREREAFADHLEKSVSVIVSPVAASNSLEARENSKNRNTNVPVDKVNKEASSGEVSVKLPHFVNLLEELKNDFYIKIPNRSTYRIPDSKLINTIEINYLLSYANYFNKEMKNKRDANSFNLFNEAWGLATQPKAREIYSFLDSCVSLKSTNKETILNIKRAEALIRQLQTELEKEDLDEYDSKRILKEIEDENDCLSQILELNSESISLNTKEFPWKKFIKFLINIKDIVNSDIMSNKFQQCNNKKQAPLDKFSSIAILFLISKHGHKVVDLNSKALTQEINNLGNRFYNTYHEFPVSIVEWRKIFSVEGKILITSDTTEKVSNAKDLYKHILDIKEDDILKMIKKLHNKKD